ncbi:MAG: MFS transporter, partial [Thermomicrobiales bacterium]
YYGWRIASALSITETVSWGILYYAFSVFLVPMQQELGWSLATMTGAYSLALLISGVCAPLVGRWLDHHGPRALMTGGSIVGVVCIVAWSRAQTVPGFYLLWAGIGLAMSATLYEPAFATLTRWFDRGRSRAFLVMTITAGFASTIFLPLSGFLVERNGWRNALLILAIILAIFTIPLHALVLRRTPKDMNLEIDGGVFAAAPTKKPRLIQDRNLTLKTVLGEPSFWWLTGAFVLQSFATVAVSIILIPYLTGRGDDPAFAAAVVGLIGAAQVLSRILATAFGERMSAIALTAFVFGLQAFAIGVLLGWQNHAGIISAILLLGAGRGVVTLMRAQLVGDLYGRTHYGAINGTLALFLTGAGALAPVSAGIAFGVFGGYTPILIGMAVCSLLAAVAMMCLNIFAR